MSWAADLARDLHDVSRHAEGSGPPTRSTRPLRACAKTPGPWLIAAVGIFWVLAMPDYLVFSMASAIPVALGAMGRLVKNGVTM
jgi:hypothetical protein